MGHTNSTANYNLPQFVGSDKPTWLGDVNGAMSAIDAAIANAASAATDAASVATNAATVAAGAVTTANAASETATAASTAASTATATANAAADTANNAQSTAVLAKGTADAANSAIGDLTDLDTTDKSSVVNAINEVVAALPSVGGSVSVTADGVKTYSTLLNELFALIDTGKLNVKSKLTIGNNIFHYNKVAGGYYMSNFVTDASGLYENSAVIATTNSKYTNATVAFASGTWSYVDASATVPAADTIIEFTY